MSWKTAALIILAVVYLYRLCLHWLNRRSADRPIPENVRDVYDPETYAIVYFCRDSAGNVSMTGLRDFGKPTYITDGQLMGGWCQSDDPTLGDGERQAVKQAAEEWAAAKGNGITCEPVALLASQVVAGYNCCYLCQVTPDGGETTYALVYTYEDLRGGVECNGVVMLPEA